MATEKEELEKLARIVADLDAAEEDWLPACVAAGEKSLVGFNKSDISSGLVNSAKLLAVLSLALSSAFACAIFLSASASLMIQILGFPQIQYSIIGFAQILALIVVFFGSIGFWLHFAFKDLRAGATIPWITMTTLLCCALPSYAILLQAVIFFACLFSFALFGRLGKTVATKVSRLYVEDVLTYAGLVSLLPTLYVVGTNWLDPSMFTFIDHSWIAFVSACFSELFGRTLPAVMAMIAIVGPIGAVCRLAQASDLKTRLSLSLLFLAPMFASSATILLVHSISLAYTAVCTFFSASAMPVAVFLPILLQAGLEGLMLISSVLLVCASQRFVDGLSLATQECEKPLLTEQWRELTRISVYRFPRELVY